MAQHDYNIANQSGADFRADLNNALLAIATVNSGATEPSTTFAHQLWVDTANSVLKIRNAADNAWITTGVSITASNTFTGDLTGNVTGNLTGNVTGNVTGDLTGNADSADILSTARTISLSGDVVGSVSFDGSANVDIDTVVQINSITLGTDTTGDYVESLSGGTGVTVTGGTGEGSTPSVAIGQAVATTDNVTFNLVTATDEFIGDIDGAIRFTAKADEALSKGDVVYVSGVSGNTTTVGKAKADDASKMPAFGMAIEDANANNNLQIVTFGNLTNIDTSNESVGEILYVSTTAGEYTTTPPTGESTAIQNIGKVLRSHAVNGSIKVGGAGRSNATPNLDNGKIFIGNASNQAVTTTLDTSIVVENTNLYYTQARFDSAFSAKSTSDLSEGTNLYYTNTRANSAIDARVTKAFVDALGIQASSVDANSVTLGTDTVGNYVATITGTANKITVTGSGSESANITLTLPDDVQIADSLTVAGNLTVNGTLTSLDTTNLDIEDNLFQLNAGLTGSPVNDSGMLINRGDQNNGIFMWDESVDKFTLGLTTADGTSTGNITLSSLGTLVANLEGNVTGTIQTAAQPNITSLGTLTGLTTTGNINFGDNDKAIFGAGSDLQIYHSGTNSIISEQGTGVLEVRTNGTEIQLTGNSGTDYMARFVSNGETQLHYDGSAKLATTSTGIDVTGTATMDGLTVDGSSEIRSTFDATLNITSTAFTVNSGDVYGSLNFVTEDGSVDNDRKNAATIQAINSGGAGSYCDLDFYTSAGTGAANSKSLKIASNGDISFYNNTGTNQALFWDASTERLGLGNTLPTSALDVTGTVTADGLTVDGTSILDSETNFVPNSTASNKSLVLASSGSTGGTGQYGASLAFSRINTDSPRAAIAAVNTDSNFERMGLSFWTHQDNTVSNMVKRMQIDHDGDISFYDDTGTSQALYWDASAESLGIGTTSPNADLHLRSVLPDIRLEDSDDGSEARISYNTAGNNGLIISSDEGNEVANSVIAFKVDASEKARIDSSGRLLINKTSATGSLSLESQAPSGFSVGSGFYSASTQSTIEFKDTNTTANYKVRIGSETDDLVMFAGGSKRMTIDSSGNVGIGTTSPSEKLHISGSSPSGDITARIVNTDTSSATSYASISLVGGDNEASIRSIHGTAGAGVLAFYNENSERMRISTSGHVMFGTTTVTPATTNVTGVSALNDGRLHISAQSQTSLFVNRKGTDGTIVDFLKDGTTVGSIGASTGYLYIGQSGTTDAFLKFTGVSIPSIRPATASGANSDDTTDLGASSTRFQDLYLSGGAYLGGTAAANKLDDYEEGTWTPTYVFDIGGGSINYINQSATYTKVGRLVTVSFLIRADGISDSDYYLRLGGIPFNGTGVGQTIGRVGIQNPLRDTFNLSVEGGTTTLLFYATNGHTDYARGDDVNDQFVSGSFTYMTA